MKQRSINSTYSKTSSIESISTTLTRRILMLYTCKPSQYLNLCQYSGVMDTSQVIKEELDESMKLRPGDESVNMRNYSIKNNGSTASLGENIMNMFNRGRGNSDEY